MHGCAAAAVHTSLCFSIVCCSFCDKSSPLLIGMAFLFPRPAAFFELAFLVVPRLPAFFEPARDCYG